MPLPPKSGGAVAHGWARTIHWPAVTRLACGSIPASIVTLVVLWQLDLNGESSRSLVNLVLCFALLLTAASLVFRKAITARYRWRLEQFDPGTTARATVLVGAVLGVLGLDFFGGRRRGRCDQAIFDDLFFSRNKCQLMGWSIHIQPQP